MYGNIRLLPGLEGGGFARVVQVEPIKSNVTSGGAAVALRLEKLANPLAGFKQDLSTYTSSENGKKSVPSTAVPQLSSEVLTMLQQIDGQPAKAQTQSAGSVYAAEAEQAEARRREYARQQEEQQQQHQEALAALEAQLKKASEGLTPVPAPSAEAVTGDITQTNSALAAQAAQAYAATLIGTSSSEASVSA